MSELPDEFTRRRKTRALITAALLLGVMVLIYFITLARMH
jgi:hypothetical protein